MLRLTVDSNASTAGRVAVSLESTMAMRRLT